MKVYIQVKDENGQTFEGFTELRKSKKQKVPKQSQIAARGPTDIIKDLYNEKYFENTKTLTEVEKTFKSKKYNFAITGIVSALTRAKFLQRKGKRGSYSYIQKVPPD